MSKSHRKRNRPVRHRRKWRVRWTDEFGVRHSETYEDRETAQVMLDRHLLRVKEIRLGLRTGKVPDRTFAELAALYKKEYAPTKRSSRTIISILDTHHDDLLRVISGVMRAVRAGAFWPNRDWHCRGCEFAGRCLAG